MGHVDERDPDLLLDPLQLDLHLLAELQVEGAERLVEEQDGGPVDQGPGERDALGLAAGDLVRLAVLEARQLDELEHVGDAALDLRSPSGPCRRRPKATFSKIVRWGKRA